MAANTALIRAAFTLGETEAAANVLNLKPLYDSDVNRAKRGMEMVSGAIDEIKRDQATEEAKKQVHIEGLQRDANGVYKSVYEMEETLPDKVVNALEDEIDIMQNDFARFVELAGDDEKAINKEYARMSAQFSKMKNEVVNLRKNLMLMTQDSDTWDVGNIHKDNIDPLRSIFQLVERGALAEIDTIDDISMSYVDGKLTWNTENYGESKDGKLRSFNSDQMLEMLPRKNPKHMTSKLEQLNGMTLLGKNDAVNGTYNYNDQMAIGETNKHISDIKTKVDFQNASREQKSEDVVIPALKESLMQRVDIPLHVMNNVFVDEDGDTIPVGEELFAMLNVVKDGDQVLDEADFKKGMSGKNKEAFKAAYAELIDVYTNIYNPAFNLQNSLVLKGQQDEAYSKQHYDQAFEAEGGKIPGKYYPPKKGEEGYTMQSDTYYRVGAGGKEMGLDILTAYASYSKGEDFNSYTDEFSFSKKSGSWMVTGPSDPKKDGSFDGPITTRSQNETELVALMGFDKQAQRLGFKGIASSKQVFEEVPLIETEEVDFLKDGIPKNIKTTRYKKKWLKQEIAKWFLANTRAAEGGDKPDKALLDALNKELEAYK